jgi:small subunit ribosomal protein S19
MTRSLHKGPYVDERVLKKVLGKRPENTGVIKTWIRRSDISPEMVGFTFGVYNGKTQKEIDQKKKEAEISAAKTAKATVDTKKK